MSLQVWLPLNEDLHNQGLSNITVTNNGATINNNGKIGKCYYFNGSNSRLSFSPTVIDGASQISVALWIYTTTSSLTGACFSLEYNSYWQFTIYKTFLELRDNSTGLTSNTRKEYSIGNFTTNAWTHLAITYNQGNIHIYKNGILTNSYSTGGTKLNTGLNNGRIGGAVENGYYFNGRINDVRIYDHALSPKEVEEISKGLVLHYKLDDRFAEGTTNLAAQLVAGGRTIVTNNIVKNTGENADTYWYIKPKEALVGGATYTVSCNCTGFSSASTYISFGVEVQSVANNAGTWKIYNGYNTFTFTIPSGLNGSTAIIFDDNGGTRTQIFEISNVQLEKKDHATPWTLGGTTRTPTTIYDSSGYSNNGTIISSLSATAPSPRYDVATSFNGSSYIKNTNFSLSSTDWTVSLWYYRSETLNGYESIFCLSKGNGADENKKIAIIPRASYTWFKCESGNGAANPHQANTWINIIIQSNGSVYKNGIKILTITPGSVLSDCTDLVIGARASATGATAITVPYKGQVSDVRIYATVLNENQIKELYNTSMQIDSNGNVYARELNEL